MNDEQKVKQVYPLAYACGRFHPESPMDTYAYFINPVVPHVDLSGDHKTRDEAWEAAWRNIQSREVDV